MNEPATCVIRGLPPARRPFHIRRCRLMDQNSTVVGLDVHKKNLTVAILPPGAARPAEVLTIDVNDEGEAQVTRANELDLDKWLEEYTLDEVWRMGRIGGRP